MVDLLLLETIDDQWMHGWALMHQLRERSDDVLDLPEGTLYPALHRLRNAGCLDWRDERVDGRNRRYYRITENGREHLAVERESWRQLKTAVDAIQSRKAH